MKTYVYDEKAPRTFQPVTTASNAPHVRILNLPTIAGNNSRFEKIEDAILKLDQKILEYDHRIAILNGDVSVISSFNHVINEAKHNLEPILKSINTKAQHYQVLSMCNQWEANNVSALVSANLLDTPFVIGRCYLILPHQEFQINIRQVQTVEETTCLVLSPEQFSLSLNPLLDPVNTIEGELDEEFSYTSAYSSTPYLRILQICPGESGSDSQQVMVHWYNFLTDELTVDHLQPIRISLGSSGSIQTTTNSEPTFANETVFMFTGPTDIANYDSNKAVYHLIAHGLEDLQYYVAEEVGKVYLNVVSKHYDSTLLNFIAQYKTNIYSFQESMLYMFSRGLFYKEALINLPDYSLEQSYKLFDNVEDHTTRDFETALKIGSAPALEDTNDKPMTITAILSHADMIESTVGEVAYSLRIYTEPTELPSFQYGEYSTNNNIYEFLEFNEFYVTDILEIVITGRAFPNTSVLIDPVEIHDTEAELSFSLDFDITTDSEGYFTAKAIKKMHVNYRQDNYFPIRSDNVRGAFEAWEKQLDFAGGHYIFEVTRRSGSGNQNINLTRFKDNDEFKLEYRTYGFQFGIIKVSFIPSRLAGFESLSYTSEDARMLALTVRNFANNIIQDVKLNSLTERLERVERLTNPTVIGSFASMFAVSSVFMGVTKAALAMEKLSSGFNLLEDFVQGRYLSGMLSFIGMNSVMLAKRRNKNHGSYDLDHNDDLIGEAAKMIRHSHSVEKYAKRNKNYGLPPYNEIGTEDNFVAITGEPIKGFAASKAINEAILNVKPGQFGYQRLRKLREKGLMPEHHAILIQSHVNITEPDGADFRNYDLKFTARVGISEGAVLRNHSFNTAGTSDKTKAGPGMSFVYTYGDSSFHDVGKPFVLSNIKPETYVVEKSAALCMDGYNPLNLRHKTEAELDAIDSRSPEEILTNIANKSALTPSRVVDFTPVYYDQHMISQITESFNTEALRNDWNYMIPNRTCQQGSKALYDKLVHGTDSEFTDFQWNPNKKHNNQDLTSNDFYSQLTAMYLKIIYQDTTDSRF